MTQSETHPLTASVLTPCLPRPLAEVAAEWPGPLAGPGALARAVPWPGTPLLPFSASQTLALLQGPERNISCSALHPHLGLGVPSRTSHGHLLEPGDPPIREVLLVSSLYTGQGARLSLPPDSAVAAGPPPPSLTGRPVHSHPRPVKRSLSSGWRRGSALGR